MSHLRPTALARRLRLALRQVRHGYRPERHYMRGGRTPGAKSALA